MESLVDALCFAYDDLVAAMATVLESKESSGGKKSAATDSALENFKQKLELFRVSCDHAEEFVESAKLRIGSECIVDEATGASGGASGRHGLPPISAVRLEQMSKAVRWLVIELQHGSGATAAPHPHSSPPFDGRFSEEAAQ
ncbi:mediator of RNA polymerase II transcription subunit-like protein [Wolffia australiana]